jgi:hypothetical protein
MGFGWGADETHRQIPVIEEEYEEGSISRCSFVIILSLSENGLNDFKNDKNKILELNYYVL